MPMLCFGAVLRRCNFVRCLSGASAFQTTLSLSLQWKVTTVILKETNPGDSHFHQFPLNHDCGRMKFLCLSSARSGGYPREARFFKHEIIGFLRGEVSKGRG